jgi:hypothetical protein
VELDGSKWSGEGTFTQVLIDCLKQIEEVAFVRVEDAPASRSEADYNFISNEIFVGFATSSRSERTWKFGLLPTTTVVSDKKMTVHGLEQALAAHPEVGSPDYSDDGMLQYMRAERIVPPYQTRGYKLVELVRIYEVGSRRDPPNA